MQFLLFIVFSFYHRGTGKSNKNIWKNLLDLYRLHKSGHYVVVWKISVGVQKATRPGPCDFKGFQRHLQSAYVLVRLIHLPWLVSQVPLSYSENRNLFIIFCRCLSWFLVSCKKILNWKDYFTSKNGWSVDWRFEGLW